MTATCKNIFHLRSPWIQRDHTTNQRLRILLVHVINHPYGLIPPHLDINFVYQLDPLLPPHHPHLLVHHAYQCSSVPRVPLPTRRRAILITTVAPPVFTRHILWLRLDRRNVVHIRAPHRGGGDRVYWGISCPSLTVIHTQVPVTLQVALLAPACPQPPQVPRTRPHPPM